jgi:hypothetical protein
VTAPQRPAPPPISTALRPVLGVMAGLGVAVVIDAVGVFASTFAAAAAQGTRDVDQFVAPSWTFPTHLLIYAVGAAAGGAVTGRMTAERSAYSVFLLALILLMSAVGPLLRHVPPTPGQPQWFALALVFVNPLAALTAGLLTRRADARRRAASAS